MLFSTHVTAEFRAEIIYRIPINLQKNPIKYPDDKWTYTEAIYREGNMKA